MIQNKNSDIMIQCKDGVNYTQFNRGKNGKPILIQCKDGVIYTMGSNRIHYRKNNGHGYYFFDFHDNTLTLFRQCRVNRYFYPFVSYEIGTEVVNGETIDSELKKLREMGYETR